MIYDFSGGDSGEQQPVTGELKKLKELLRKEFFINSRKVYGTKQWDDYCTENGLNYIDSSRCRHELLVEKFFGLAESVTEQTEIKTDFGQLVNLVAIASQPPTPEPAGELYWKQLAEGYKKLLKITSCPDILLENPWILFATTTPTEADLSWAEDVIKRYENQKVEPQQNQDE